MANVKIIMHCNCLNPSKPKRPESKFCKAQHGKNRVGQNKGPMPRSARTCMHVAVKWNLFRLLFTVKLFGVAQKHDQDLLICCLRFAHTYGIQLLSLAGPRIVLDFLCSLRGDKVMNSYKKLIDDFLFNLLFGRHINSSICFSPK